MRKRSIVIMVALMAVSVCACEQYPLSSVGSSSHLSQKSMKEAIRDGLIEAHDILENRK